MFECPGVSLVYALVDLFMVLMEHIVNRDELVAKLEHLDACYPAISWVASFLQITTAEEVWGLCPCADWLVWLASELYVELSIDVWQDLALSVAETVEHLDPSGAAARCNATARRFLRGEATLEELMVDARAADAVADAAALDDVLVADAADSAVHAAEVACPATSLRDDATYAGAITHTATYVATRAATRAEEPETRARQTQIVRSAIPWALVEKGLLR